MARCVGCSYLVVVTKDPADAARDTTVVPGGENRFRIDDIAGEPLHPGSQLLVTVMYVLRVVAGASVVAWTQRQLHYAAPRQFNPVRLLVRLEIVS